VKVIVPVGLLPPDRTAESVKVIGELPRVALVGLGVVVRDGLAGITTTCSLGPPRSEAASLFASPE
jgi:hypothetical protein